MSALRVQPAFGQRILPVQQSFPQPARRLTGGHFNTQDSIRFGRFEPDSPARQPVRSHWFRSGASKLMLALTLAVGGMVGITHAQSHDTRNQLEQLEALQGSSQYALELPDGSVRIITSAFQIPSDIVASTAPASFEISSPLQDNWVSHGSGVVIRDAEGQFFILTNHHVINAPIEAGVQPEYHLRPFGTSQDLRGEVVAADPDADMALMRVTIIGWTPEHFIDVSRIRDTGENPLAPNEPLFEVGNPGENNDLIIPGVGFNHSRDRNESLEYLAGCYGGSSGSPIYDLEGNLVGLGKAISTPTKGRCFGVKSSDILRLLREWGVKLKR